MENASSLERPPILSVEEVPLGEKFVHTWGTAAARGNFRGSQVLVVVSGIRAMMMMMTLRSGCDQPTARGPDL
jgi:hypothetical protein